MKPIHRHVTRFWSEERSLTVFLAVLVIEIFVIAPINIAGFAISLVNGILFSLLLLTGLLTMTRRKSLQAAVATLVVLGVATHWARILFDMQELIIPDLLLFLVCTIGFLVIVLWQVYREGTVTIHRIQGAVPAYLLLSIIFAAAYALAEHMKPGSFQIPAAQAHFGGRFNQAFYYFSVVTLTTTGYGDITAVHPLARSLVMMEALVGQLYPAILIARLVSLHIEEKKDRRGR
ncbi:MAG TPA: potassium channel family protein [Syntrophales bacterium]|nr:potassium channel family protein [Syntrophales bacterium]HQL89092.1 potassium channel family protein [Syntrophales bacterium]